MPDTSITSRANAPHGWGEALAALPLERPDGDGWARIAMRLDARRRGSQWPAWLAIAAALLLAIALPWRLSQPGPQYDGAGDHVQVAAATAPRTLDALYAESAQLEGLLALARDDRVASASAAILAGQLDAQMAAIDAALRQPDLTDGQRLALWRQRVDTLRSAVSFESNRRWLVAQGERYDGALVQVD